MSKGTRQIYKWLENLSREPLKSGQYCKLSLDWYTDLEESLSGEEDKQQQCKSADKCHVDCRALSLLDRDFLRQLDRSGISGPSGLLLPALPGL